MKKQLLIALCCLFTFNVFGTELQLNNQEEVFSFGNGLIGIQCDRKPTAFFTLRQINFKCEEVRKLKIDLGEGKWTFNYQVMGNRLVVETYNKTLETSQIYVYDTTLTLISKRPLSKVQIKNRYTRTGSTDSKFDMAEYYNRVMFTMANALPPCDQFIDDGLLFLKCDESLMRTIPYGITNAGKLSDKNSNVVIYRLKWGKDEGDFPVHFDVKWSVKLPPVSVLGYRFYTYGKNAIFLYLVSADGDEMKSYYYRLDPESGEIIQTIEVKLSNGAIPWVSSAHYDELSDQLFIIGNYQTEKRKKETFDGYFLSVVDKHGEVKSVLKSFPVLPENTVPTSWQKNPMIIAGHFVKGNSGKYTAVCSFIYSFTVTSAGSKSAPASSSEVMVLAAIMLVDFDISLAQIEPRIFMFDKYDKNAQIRSSYGLNSTFQIMNRFTLMDSGIYPLISDISGSGVAEMLCLNMLEESKPLNQTISYSFYVLSTDSEAKMKKSFDYDPNGKTVIGGHFPGAPGEIIYRWSTSERGDYLAIVKTHL